MYKVVSSAVFVTLLTCVIVLALLGVWTGDGRWFASAGFAGVLAFCAFSWALWHWIGVSDVR